MWTRLSRWTLPLTLAAVLAIPAAAQAGDRGRSEENRLSDAAGLLQPAGYRDHEDRHRGRDHGRRHDRGERHHGRRDRHRYRHHRYYHYHRPPVIWRHYGHRHGYKHRHHRRHRPHGRFELHFDLGGRR
ncbi:hypothetical protein H0Z60_00620 [Ectothiorhodospiraceae bacterium WFHF3C12]|nr:hypothetical protein [Ectothiorhodospiraceae bacterium WFHF3C12]